MNDNVKTIKKSYIFLAVAGFILIIFIVLYSLGFRFAGGLKIGKVGKVSITAPLINTSVYVDKSTKLTTKKDNETLTLKLSPKKHSIIVSRESYYPWKKDFEVKSGSVTKIEPLYVSQNPSGSMIGTLDPEYWSIVNSIRGNKMPTTEKPKVSSDGKVSVWVNDGTIFAKTGDKEIEVTNISTEVKNVDFYKNRSDAIIFSTTIGVYVIEIDATGGQNFMPIYKGQNPYFIANDPNYIYVQDGNTLMQVII
jgi:hypothetical protein